MRAWAQRSTIATGVVILAGREGAEDRSGTAPAATTAPPGVSAEPDAAAEWPVGDAPAGFDAVAVDAAVDRAFGPEDDEQRMRSIPAVHGGEIVYEHSHPLDGHDTLLSSSSAVTSVTSTLVGLLVHAEVVADIVGGPDALADTGAELLDPIGITSTDLVEDPTGQSAGGLDFDCTTRDFARFGPLHLRGGRWGGRQILSDDRVRYSAEPSDTSDDDGAQWWLSGPHGSQMALGLFGQHVLVEHDLVIVSTATPGGESRAPLMALPDELARAVG